MLTWRDSSSGPPIWRCCGTEGWPAGLYLAGALDPGRHDSARVARFGGDDRLMADYLRDEMLASLDSPPSRSYARRSWRFRAAATRPTAHRLGDAAPDISRSNPRRAARQHRRGVPPPLLAGMLRAELRRADPDRGRRPAPEAERLVRGGGPTTSRPITLIEAGDPGDVAADADVGPRASIAHGRGRSIRAWLDRSTPRADRRAPAARAHGAPPPISRRRPRPPRALARRAERLIAGGEEIDGALRRGRGGMRAAVARRARRDGRRRRARVLELTPRTTRGDACAACCAARPAPARRCRRRAVGLLEEGARRRLAAPSVQVLCLAQLALIHADR